MDQKQLYSVEPLGDSAMLISFGNEINETINIKVLAIFSQLKKAAIKGVRDIVPAYCSLAIYYDPITVPGDISAYEYFSGQIKSILYMQDELSQELSEKIRVPVCYADKYGLDIRSLAVAKNITADDVIKIHTGKTYRVYMIGFLPGFAYMGEVDER